MENILSIRDLTKQFGGLTAVNKLSFDVKKGSIHALIGPNGSGKTTTLSMIAGSLKPTQGTIVYKGEPINPLREYERAQKGIGRTFQNIKLFPSMTVQENIMTGAVQQTSIGITRFIFDIVGTRKEEKMLKEKACEVLNMLGMYHLKDELVKNLPYGNQKVLELGRSIINNPELILLDEPAAGLNPSERSEFVDILLKLNEQGKTLLLIEHNMDVVMKISKRLTVLNFGCKIAEDAPEGIQKNPDVIKAYLGDRFVQKQ